MDKISTSIIITGSLFSIMVIFSTTFNQVFAIEYSTYTSKNLGIEFQYPSDWKIDEFDDPNTIGIFNQNDDSPLNIRQDWVHEGKAHDLQAFTDEWFATTNELLLTDKDKIIQKPVLISTENLEMQTFLYTVDSKDAFQHWTFVANGHEYSIDFVSPIAEFNSPENVEILDHFIKSIKIISSNKNP